MTKIEWTDATWNPIAGCNDVSEGCRHCYARGMAKRLEAMGQQKYAGLTVLQGSKTVWTGKIAFDEKALLAPLKRKKPTRYFVNSMSDLFHPNVTDEMRDKIFAVMALCPQHTFQVLTKRPDAMRLYLKDCVGCLADVIEANRTDKPRRAVGPLPHFNCGERWFPLANVWLGVSVEDQKTAVTRIVKLLQTPAAKRFVSAEPLLGHVDLAGFVPFVIDNWSGTGARTDVRFCARCGATFETSHHCSLPALDWVIVGGESGHGARPMHPDWARRLRDQCKTAGVPFFFKQWGDLAPGAQGANYASAKRMYTRIDIQGNPSNDPTSWAATDALFYRVGKKAAGALLDGVLYREMPA